MSEALAYKRLVMGPLSVNCYIVACTSTNEALVIDPGDEAPRIVETAAELGWTIKTIVNSHAHFDHTGANAALKLHTGAQLLLHEEDLQLLSHLKEHAEGYGITVEPSPEPDRLLKDKDTIKLGNLVFKVKHTPGHSRGGICLLSNEHVFVGDTLFAGSIGRTDLPGGNFQELINSIKTELLSLDDSTKVLPGHGPESTIAEERNHNPFLNVS